MDSKQIAGAYAVARILGYEKPLDDFEKEYRQYYHEALEELNERPVIAAKVESLDMRRF